MKIGEGEVCGASAARPRSKFQMARVMRVAREWWPMPRGRRSVQAARTERREERLQCAAHGRVVGGGREGGAPQNDFLPPLPHPHAAP